MLHAQVHFYVVGMWSDVDGIIIAVMYVIGWLLINYALHVFDHLTLEKAVDIILR